MYQYYLIFIIFICITSSFKYYPLQTGCQEKVIFIYKGKKGRGVFSNCDIHFAIGGSHLIETEDNHRELVWWSVFCSCSPKFHRNAVELSFLLILVFLRWHQFADTNSNSVSLYAWVLTNPLGSIPLLSTVTLNPNIRCALIYILIIIMRSNFATFIKFSNTAFDV